jgi:hypothetical protein
MEVILDPDPKAGKSEGSKLVDCQGFPALERSNACIDVGV